MATRRIKLSQWAAQQGIHTKTALRWVHEGRVPSAVQNAGRRWFVEVEPEDDAGTEVVLYGRVSSSDQRADLERQLARLRDFAAARGFVVMREVSEIGSGLNGHRPRLMKLLEDPTAKAVLVEHRDRLCRFGFDYIQAALKTQSRVVLVVNEGEEALDLVQDFVDVVTSMCARIYGRRGAQNRAARAIRAAETPA